MILLCQSILETRQVSHLYGSALFTIPLMEHFSVSLLPQLLRELNESRSCIVTKIDQSVLYISERSRMHVQSLNNIGLMNYIDFKSVLLVFHTLDNVKLLVHLRCSLYHFILFFVDWVSYLTVKRRVIIVICNYSFLRYKITFLISESIIETSTFYQHSCL